MGLPHSSVVATTNPPMSASSRLFACGAGRAWARYARSVASVCTTITKGANCQSVQKAAVDALTYVH
eukprot:COSAG05_NODE_16568_length_343_cov_0.631148_1_plen_66_part_10